MGLERLHDEKWISEDEAKRILIESAYCKFLEESVKIDMDFPHSYRINDKKEASPKIKFNEWWLKEGCRLKPLFKKYEELSKRLNLNFTLDEEQ